MTTICVCNQKGGTGKTTTANILTAKLTEKGYYKVLAVDADSQANLSVSKGAIGTDKTLLGVMLGEVDMKDAIVHTATGDVVPSNSKLAVAPTALSEETGKEYRLKEALDTVAGSYDFTVIDVPPSLNVLTINALVSADKVVVPVTCDGYSLQGLDQLVKTIRDIRKYFNPGLEVTGVLLTKYDCRTRVSKEVTEVLEKMTAELGTKVFDSKIRRTTKADELQFRKEGLFKYAPKSNLAIDYSAWVDELLDTL